MKTKNWRRAVSAALAATMMCCFVLAPGIPATARPVRGWSTAELWAKADLVVIATAKSTQDAENQRFDHPQDDTWVAVETVFDAQASLKGGLKEKTLTLRHLRYYNKQAEVTVRDGPAFVEFDVHKKNSYLMFLKRGTDGLYEPLTGQTDPYQSFIMLQPYHVTKER